MILSNETTFPQDSYRLQPDLLQAVVSYLQEDSALKESVLSNGVVGDKQLARYAVIFDKLNPSVYPMMARAWLVVSGVGKAVQSFGIRSVVDIEIGRIGIYFSQAFLNAFSYAVTVTVEGAEAPLIAQVDSNSRTERYLEISCRQLSGQLADPAHYNIIVFGV